MNNSSKEFDYFAFISYKREDEKWAKWLQKKLESYSLPTAIRKENPELPNKIRPVFRDQSELAGGNLKTEIEKGLDGSKYLIVICSPRSAKSPWVSKEVQYFIDQGREEYIIPFIIGGTPNASNPEDECFPEGLRQLIGEREILGININEMGRDAATIKVIARMFNLRFDTLWQRYERSKKIKYVTSLLLLSFACVVIGILCWQYIELDKNRSDIAALHAQDLIKKGSCYEAINILMEVNEKLIFPTENFKDALRFAYNRIKYEGYAQIGEFSNNIGRAKAVAISDDNQLFASGDENGNIFIIDIKTGEHKYTIRTCGKLIEDIAFSKDSKKLAFSLRNPSRTIIFDLVTQKTIKINEGGGNVSFINGDSAILTIGQGDILKFCTDTGNKLDSLSIYSKFGGYAREFTTNKDMVVISVRKLMSSSPSILVVNANTLKGFFEYKGVEDRSYHSQLINDSTILYRYGNKLKFLSIHNSEIIDSIDGISSDKFCVYGDKIIYEDGKSLMLYSKKCKRLITSHENYVTDICISFDGKYILSSGADGKVKIINGEYPSAPVLTEISPITNLSAANTLLSCATWYENVYIINISSDSIIFKSENNNRNQLHNPALLNDCELWYINHSNNTYDNLTVFNLDKEQRKNLKVPAYDKLYVTSQKYAVTSYYDMYVYHLANDSLRITLKGKPSITADPLLNKVAYFTRLRGDTLILQDLDRETIDTIQMKEDGETLKFSLESNYLAVGNTDYSVSIYDLMNNRACKNIYGQNSDHITDIWLSSNSGLIFYTCRDGTVTSCDLNTGRVIYKIKPSHIDLPGGSYPTSLLFYNENLYVGTLDGKLYKYTWIGFQDIMVWAKKYRTKKKKEIFVDISDYVN